MSSEDDGEDADADADDDATVTVTVTMWWWDSTGPTGPAQIERPNDRMVSHHVATAARHFVWVRVYYTRSQHTYEERRWMWAPDGPGRPLRPISSEAPIVAGVT